MRQYKVIKRKGGLDEGVVIGEFTANDDMSTLVFARQFRDFVIQGPEGYDAWHGYQAVPLCEECGEMLDGPSVKRQVYEGCRDPAICDKCHYKDTLFAWGKGLDDEYASKSA